MQLQLQITEELKAEQWWCESGVRAPARKDCALVDEMSQNEEGIHFL